MNICAWHLCDKETKTKFCSVNHKNSYHVTIKRRKNKIKAIEYLGGACERCGWDEHPAGFEFHHREANKKEFGLSAGGYSRSWVKMEAELKKCHLLCANCHQVIHATTDEKWIDIVG